MQKQLEQMREQTTPSNFINEKETRTLALVAFICCISFFLTDSILIYWFLTIEFTLRVFTNIEYTPVKLLSKLILPLLKIRPHLIPIAPKKLAALLGLIFCIAILSSQYLNNILLTRILVGCMALFAFLEFSINFCVATLVYNVVKKENQIKKDNRFD
jgi:hypothetical protein